MDAKMMAMERSRISPVEIAASRAFTPTLINKPYKTPMMDVRQRIVVIKDHVIAGMNIRGINAAAMIKNFVPGSLFQFSVTSSGYICPAIKTSIADNPRMYIGTTIFGNNATFAKLARSSEPGKPCRIQPLGNTSDRARPIWTAKSARKKNA